MEFTLRQWQEKFNAGDFEAPDFDTQVAAGWYDWFCEDEDLSKKLDYMGGIIRCIREGGKIPNLDDVYVWFKNNCPCVGDLYDDFRISREDVNLFVVQVDSPYTPEKFAVYTPDDGYDKPVLKTSNPQVLVNWFNAPADPIRDGWWFRDQNLFYPDSHKE